MNLFLGLGLLLGLAGCASLYFGARHQRLLARRWPARPARIAGVLLLAGGLAALLAAAQPATAVFILCTWAMLLFVLLPYLGALRTSYRSAPGLATEAAGDEEA